MQAVVLFGLWLAAPDALLVDRIGSTAKHCCSKVPAASQYIDPSKRENGTLQQPWTSVTGVGTSKVPIRTRRQARFGDSFCFFLMVFYIFPCQRQPTMIPHAKMPGQKKVRRPPKALPPVCPLAHHHMHHHILSVSAPREAAISSSSSFLITIFCSRPLSLASRILFNALAPTCIPFSISDAPLILYVTRSCNRTRRPFFSLRQPLQNSNSNCRFIQIPAQSKSVMMRLF